MPRSKATNATTTDDPVDPIASKRVSPKPPKPIRSGGTSGGETRLRIIEAAVETLRVDGITGASARTIARHGDFNQALIFYHFGSIDGLLVAAAISEGNRRSARYAERFAAVRTLPELVGVAREVHHEEQIDGAVTVLAQMLAGASSSPELRAGVMAGVGPWMELVEAAIARVICDSPFAGLVPFGDVAYAISSLFLGFELMTSVDTDGSRAATMFDTLDKMAALMHQFVTPTA